MIVMKFGGTSVGDADRIRGVASIVRDAAQAERVVVVVSAVSGVTDTLIMAAQRAAEKQVFEALQLVLNVQKLHADIVEGPSREAGFGIASPGYDRMVVGRAACAMGVFHRIVQQRLRNGLAAGAARVDPVVALAEE